MRSLRAGWRLLRVVWHLLVGVAEIYTTFSHRTSSQKDARVQAWALELLAKLAIKLVVHGQPPLTGPVLLAANHLSWLDIVVMHAARHCRFISKSDIKHWPVVGTLATAAGTLYIERESRRDAMRVVHHMMERLQQGDVLAVFPEGTTGDGTRLLPFHANLFQAAIAANKPVQPVALRFVDGATGTMSLAPCYVGDDTLLQSLWRTVCTDGLVAEVRFGELQLAQGRDRRTWAADVRRAVQTLRGDALD